MTKQEIDAKIAELQELRETAPDELKPFEWSLEDSVFHISYCGKIEATLCEGDELFASKSTGDLQALSKQLKLLSLIYSLKLSLGDTTGVPDGSGWVYTTYYDAEDHEWCSHSLQSVRHFGVYFTEENCKKVVEYLNENCPNGRVES